MMNEELQGRSHGQGLLILQAWRFSPDLQNTQTNGLHPKTRQRGHQIAQNQGQGGHDLGYFGGPGAACIMSAIAARAGSGAGY